MGFLHLLLRGREGLRREGSLFSRTCSGPAPPPAAASTAPLLSPLGGRRRLPGQPMGGPGRRRPAPEQRRPPSLLPPLARRAALFVLPVGSRAPRPARPSGAFPGRCALWHAPRAHGGCAWHRRGGLLPPRRGRRTGAPPGALQLPAPAAWARPLQMPRGGSPEAASARPPAGTRRLGQAGALCSR